MRLEDLPPEDGESLHEIVSSLSKLHQEGSLNKDQESILYLIITVSKFMLYSGKGANPFGPILRTNTGRSAIPEDLSDDQLCTLAGIAKLELPALLKARLHDVLWHRRHGEKPYLHGVAASESYLLVFNESGNEDKWVTLGTEFRRGLKLAKQFGSEKPLFQSYVTAIKGNLEATESTTKMWDARWFIECLSEVPNPDYQDLAQRSFVIGERIHRSDDKSHAGSYYEQAQLFFLRAGQEAKAKQSLHREAQVVLLLARKDYRRSKMAAAHHLARGIKLLDDAGTSKKTRTLLRRKLLRWQHESREEFSGFSHEADMSEFVQASRKHVTKGTLEEALFAFGAGYPIVDYEKLKKQVVEENSVLLTNFMSSALIAPDGRTIANVGTLDENSDRETIENHMIGHAGRFDWSFRAQGYINPARWQIFSQHHPTRESLMFLIQGNPVVPPGHGELFLRGILAGFHGDGIECLSILAPQLEGLVRNCLQRSGAVTSKLDDNFTQDEKTLGTLLDSEESRQYFGADLSLELKGILCSRHGYNLRNEIAHGMLPTNGFYSEGGINLWWLTIYILGIAWSQSQNPQAKLGASTKSSS
ncbi:DUF4209 domain-containing protein [bacterium]|nr:DUF4209 domain-containing protein [bacterium]